MSEPEDFEESLKNTGEKKYVLRLFITGMTPNSKRAVENIKKICEEYLKRRYELEVIDIYQQPSLAEAGQILAAPTLVKVFPPPVKRLIGDMSDTEKVLSGLDIRPKT